LYLEILKEEFGNSEAAVYTLLLHIFLICLINKVLGVSRNTSHEYNLPVDESFNTKRLQGKVKMGGYIIYVADST